MGEWTFVLDESTRLLFVDDDPILAEFAKVHLSTPVTTVDSAADGIEAWQRLCDERYDLVLLDIEMPKLDGFGLLEKLRADPRFEHLPVVMLTGKEDISSIDRAFQLGATSFNTKPINWRMLSYALRYVLRTTRMEAELMRQRQRAEELTQLTSNLLSLIRLEARTPIGSIIGFSDCIRQQIDGPISIDSYLGYADQIGAAARQLQDNFIDLIQYAQLSSGDARLTHDEYHAFAILDAVVSATPGGGASSDPAIIVRKPKENFYVVCDRHWLARALSHLLENARGMAGVQSVELSLDRSVKGEAVFSIVAHSEAQQGRLESQAQAPFATTTLESVRLSHGLGIPFARRIAELHDGKLSEPPKRDLETRVEITLPASRVLECVRRSTHVDAA